MVSIIEILVRPKNIGQAFFLFNIDPLEITSIKYSHHFTKSRLIGRFVDGDVYKLSRLKNKMMS